MDATPLETILDYTQAGIALRQRFFAASAGTLAEMAATVAKVFRQGGKVLLCGNGGSAADAQHLAGEFVNRMLTERNPLAAVALTTDTSVLTAVGNDCGYEHVFSKQVAALGRKGDILVAISTSGNSPNIIRAIEEAREREMTVFGLTGAGGGQMARLCDALLAVPSRCTPLVQEMHGAAGHLLCILTDGLLFGNSGWRKPESA